MENAIEMKETYCVQKNYHVLTGKETRIPALHLFGKQTVTSATGSLSPHFHRDCFEIVYIASGSANFSIGNTDYRLSGGDVFITMPNQVHSTNSLPISVCKMYWFQLEDTPGNLLYLNPSAGADLLADLKRFDTPLFHTDSKDIYPLIKSAFDSCVRESNPHLAGQYLTLLLYKLIEYQKSSTYKLTPDIQRTVTYIRRHIREEISLDELAKIAHLSTSQFKQKFKNQVGFAPRQFINYEKIEASKPLLLEGRTVTEVAALLSFDNSSYFAVVFKRFTMCSPTEFARNRTEKSGDALSPTPPADSVPASDR